jgi:flagellar biosynthesis protein FliP
LKVDVEEIRNVLTNEVLKRDVIESEAATEAQKQVKKFLRKHMRTKEKKSSVAIRKETDEEG